MGSESILKVEGVSKRYGGVQALHNVGFQLEQGEILGLIGANGAGKSTLLDIIGGEQHSDSGEIRLLGAHLTGKPHERARLGLARSFQHPKVSLELSVFENVAIGLAVREMATPWKALLLPMRAMLTGRTPSTELVEQACEEVGLSDIDRPARLLSFGELRLMEVARALIQRPHVILLDEPFPGLEDEGVEVLVSALKRLAARGHSVLVVDHNVVIVEALVHRLILLARGKVVFSGSVQDCVRSHEFQEEYVGAVR